MNVLVSTDFWKNCHLNVICTWLVSMFMASQSDASALRPITLLFTLLITLILILRPKLSSWICVRYSSRRSIQKPEQIKFFRLATGDKISDKNRNTAVCRLFSRFWAFESIFFFGLEINSGSKRAALCDSYLLLEHWWLRWRLFNKRKKKGWDTFLTSVLFNWSIWSDKGFWLWYDTTEGVKDWLGSLTNTCFFS